MRYYVRPNPTADVEGPFTLEALTDAIRAGRFAPDALASSDLGESITRLRAGRSCDWFPLAAIAELRDVVPPLPKPPAHPQRMSPLATSSCLVAALCVFYDVVKEHRWLAAILAVLLFYAAVDVIKHFVRSREKRSSAV